MGGNPVEQVCQVDLRAITARRGLDPRARAQVRIETPASTGDGTIRVHDSGIGLSEAQVHTFLATIARSDDLGFAGHEFLGQFFPELLAHTRAQLT
ncbi:hypothetical protein [Nocardia sp. NPDC058633]|uniref:hypothetical protein n=1 Tax=Nocardia sp. NPDC058633 TaxID=3346568 RepID=UPI00364B20D5